MHGDYKFKKNTLVCHERYAGISGDVEVNFTGTFFRENEKEILKTIGTHYEERETFNRLSGQFGIVVFDKQKKRLSLVRDHLGVMPLYYKVKEGSIYFGTSIDSILMMQDDRPELNKDILHEYFAYRYISGKNTIFKDIYEVKPGSILDFDPLGQVTCRDFYKFEYLEEKKDKHYTSEKLFQDGFWNSLREQTYDKDKKKFGVLSSGGIDSSILVSCSEKVLDSEFNTYYIGNENYSHNRTEEVNNLSKMFNTSHKNVFISGEIFADYLIETIRINEEPLNHPNGVLRNYLYEQMKDEMDILLSGEGADCFYCGYYVFDLVNYFFVKNPVRPLTKILMQLFPAGLIPEKYRSKGTKIKNAFILPPDEFAIFHDLLITNTRENVELMLGAKAPPKFAENYTSLFADYSKKNILDIILYVYQTHYIIEAFKTLTKLGNAHGLEHRHPFTDAKLVSQFNHFPWNEKIKFFKRKHQVVELGKKYLSKEFFRKRKEGFGVPLKKWFYNGNGLGRFVELISDKRTRERGLFNTEYLDRLLVKYHKKTLPEDSYECVIWPIINLELWCRIFIDRNVEGYS